MSGVFEKLRFLDPGWWVKPHGRSNTRVLCQESGVVEAALALYASERLVVESSGNPRPCVQALLSEAGLVEEPGGVQNPCDGFMARI